MSITTREMEDEGVAEMYGPSSQPWQSPGWGFDLLNQQDSSQQPNNSDNDDIFEDAASQDSTRVAGAGSTAGDEDLPLFSDTPMHAAEDNSDTRMRGVRESAPPPDVVVSTPMHGDTDDEDELPVTELRPGDDGQMDISFASR